MVKKTSMELYDRTRRDGLIAINLKDNDELISVKRVAPGEKVIMVSSAGKAIKWDEGEVRGMGRDTMGVRGFIAGAESADADELTDEAILNLLRNCIKRGMSRKDAVKDVTARTGEPRNRIYSLSSKL